MIKAKAGDTLVFGLSEMNIRALKDGKPIMVDLGDIGGKGKVVIFYGVTEDDMQRDFQKLIGPETDKRKRTTN